MITFIVISIVLTIIAWICTLCLCKHYNKQVPIQEYTLGDFIDEYWPSLICSVIPFLNLIDILVTCSMIIWDKIKDIKI